MTISVVSDLFALFVDFKQAFDKVDRSKMIETLAELKIPIKLVKLIAAYGCETWTLSQKDLNKKESFTVTTG